ncbi:hypothetical protein NMG60_11005884 [Bertholletia excelsa]
MASISFLLLSTFILFSRLCYGHLSLPEDYVALFIFGDSTVDAGNNNYINTTTSFQANFWPYGETFFGFPTGRPSNGRLIPDFIAEFAELPLIPPCKQPYLHQFAKGVNFASAGAGVLVETFQGLAIDLKTQVAYFKEVRNSLKKQLGEEKAERLLARAVYLFSIATNDYLSPFLSNSSNYFSYPREAYVGMVIGNLTAAIQEVYKIGGRKFGFVNMAPWGCVPLAKALNQANNGECIEELKKSVNLHNIALPKALQELERKLNGFSYSNFDLYTSLWKRMNNPAEYGFKEGKSACCGSGPYRGINSCGGKRGVKEYELCGNPNEYVFFDSGHPSEMAYQQFARLMWSGDKNVVWPCNLKALFGAEADAKHVA